MDGQTIQFKAESLHQQVSDDLLEQIENGTLKPGEPLMTEFELCREYGVSRITVRRAVATLVERGLVVRQRGVGSFVTGRESKLREFNLVGFLEDRLEFTHQLLLNEIEEADEEGGVALGLLAGDKVRHIRTIVHNEGEAFTVVDAYTKDGSGEGAGEEDFTTSLPSAQRLGRRLGRRIVRATQVLDAVAADALASEHLSISLGSPMIRSRRIYYSAGDEPIQYLIVRYHPDRYRFTVDLVPRGGSVIFQKIPPTPKYV